jgi:predicted nucleotidyltransferase component of viral defense system
MLQKSCLEPTTLDLLNSLMGLDFLEKFSLVGGTNLALRFGHRLSVDIDLLSNFPFSNIELSEKLESVFEKIETGNISNKIGLFCFINNIKVDFVQHHFFHMLEEIEVIEGVRMFGLKDIAAMKIFAMLKRPRKKDHWDIAELLKHMTLEEMIDSFFKKYPNRPLLISIPKALTYTADVDEDEDPVSLNGTSWEDIKEFIGQKVEEYLR